MGTPSIPGRTLLKRIERARYLRVAAVLLGLFTWSVAPAQPDFELMNNFLMNYSFVTGQDRGVEQNLEDNLGWMADQGYTHLRFFGIYPNGVHIFPSATLDAHGFPNSVYHESVLALLVPEASQQGVVVNFDGWEVIAESNYDTTQTGFGFMDEVDLAAVIEDVLALGVTLISEEQFGSPYLQAIQAKTQQWSATHETTAGIWWPRTDVADHQLASVFSFYPYDQDEADSIEATSSLPANLGTVHIWCEGAHYYGIPFTLAVGSFGTMEPENWKNVMLYAQVQHRPERFSVEETDWSFILGDTTFNFREHVGDEILVLADESFGERPVANLVLDAAAPFGGSFRPAANSITVNGPAIASTFTSLGYRVITTIDSIIPDADYFYVLLAGGADPSSVSPLPDYVMPLLAQSAPVILQPTYGIPDDNDAADWLPLRRHFGLPPGETSTLADVLPVSVEYNSWSVLWGGARHINTPRLELIPSAQINPDSASVVASGTVLAQEVALVLQHGNKVLINSNLIHLEVAYILSDLLAGPMRRPAGADIAYDEGRAIMFAEYDTEIDIAIPWAGKTRVTRYNPVGDTAAAADLDLAGGYAASLLRGELVTLFRVAGGLCGDANDDLTINSSDVIALVNYVFRGGPAPVYATSGDVNSDGAITAADVIYLVAYVFKSGPAPACP